MRIRRRVLALPQWDPVRQTTGPRGRGPPSLGRGGEPEEERATIPRLQAKRPSGFAQGAAHQAQRNGAKCEAGVELDDRPECLAISALAIRPALESKLEGIDARRQSGQRRLQ